MSNATLERPEQKHPGGRPRERWIVTLIDDHGKRTTKATSDATELGDWVLWGIGSGWGVEITDRVIDVTFQAV